MTITRNPETDESDGADSHRGSPDSSRSTALRRRRARSAGTISLPDDGKRLIVGLVAVLVATGLLVASWSNSTPSGRAQATALAGLAEPAPTVDAADETRQATPTPEQQADQRSAFASGRAEDLEGWPIYAEDPIREDRRPGLTPTGQPEYEMHVVTEGETLLGIALSLGVDVDQLAVLNGLQDANMLTVGEKLKVPPRAGVQLTPKPSLSRASVLEPHFIWPAAGDITTYFGETGMIWIGGRHTGLDIGGGYGDRVAAAEAGDVIAAGWATGHGYGNYVEIDHGMGYHTLYGHLSEIRVKVGDEVRRGWWIGDVGSTGVSSGPHLHFEVILNGTPVDPLDYLE